MTERRARAAAATHANSGHSSDQSAASSTSPPQGDGSTSHSTMPSNGSNSTNDLNSSTNPSSEGGGSARSQSSHSSPDTSPIESQKSSNASDRDLDALADAASRQNALGETGYTDERTRTATRSSSSDDQGSDFSGGQADLTQYNNGDALLALGRHAAPLRRLDKKAGKRKKGGQKEGESSESPTRARRAIVWFRRDLRLHDNLALHAALQESGMAVLPVYIIHKPEHKKCGPTRFQFLLECLRDLKKALEQRGSQLLVLRGEALDVLSAVIPAWDVTHLYYQEMVMPHAKARDEKVQAMCRKHHVRVRVHRGATLFEPQTILEMNEQKPPINFSEFLKLIEELPQPPLPVSTPAKVQGFRPARKVLYNQLESYGKRHSEVKVRQIAGSRTHMFDVPTLELFGMEEPDPHSFLYGGESVALRLLNEFCEDEDRVGRFQKPLTSPTTLDRPSTTALSPYVAFGSLSPREFFYRVMFIQLKFAGQQGPPEFTLDGQLMWREFFYTFAVGTPHFDSHEKNELCAPIDWKLQGSPKDPQEAEHPDTKQALLQLERWKTGRTGYPWIDAVMRQIEQEGWAHHLGRHAVACFLTRGDLYISWERGSEFFQEKLIDMDWPINVGNWLWVSSSCFFADIHSVHSPSLFIQQWDPQGKFIRKYVPQLAAMPTEYIFEPWKAPLAVQRDAGCLVGKDYPFPIVDHRRALKKCIEGLKRVHAGKSKSPVASDASNTSNTSNTSGSKTSSNSGSSRSSSSE